MRLLLLALVILLLTACGGSDDDAPEVSGTAAVSECADDAAPEATAERAIVVAPASDGASSSAFPIYELDTVPAAGVPAAVCPLTTVESLAELDLIAHQMPEELGGNRKAFDFSEPDSVHLIAYVDPETEQPVAFLAVMHLPTEAEFQRSLADGDAAKEQQAMPAAYTAGQMVANALANTSQNQLLGTSEPVKQGGQTGDLFWAADANDDGAVIGWGLRDSPWYFAAVAPTEADLSELLRAIDDAAG